MAKKAKKKLVRREYTKEDVKILKAHSKAQTPLEKIFRRDEAHGYWFAASEKPSTGIPLGHRRRAARRLPTRATKVTKTAKAKKAKK